MPVYEYQCTHCGTTYDVYHKSREIVEDVVCPSCGSPKHKKLMSAPGVAVSGRTDASCSSGSCCGGSCGVD